MAAAIASLTAAGTTRGRSHQHPIYFVGASLEWQNAAVSFLDRARLSGPIPTYFDNSPPQYLLSLQYPNNAKLVRFACPGLIDHY